MSERQTNYQEPAVNMLFGFLSPFLNLYRRNNIVQHTVNLRAFEINKYTLTNLLHSAID